MRLAFWGKHPLAFYHPSHIIRPVLPTFLLVDDNENDAFLVRRAFLKAGLLNTFCDVRSVDAAKRFLNGEAEFSDRTQYPYPSIVFLDLRMPGVSGLELLRWIKRHPQHKHLRVVMLTGTTSPRDQLEALSSGADGWLSKGSHFEQLVQISTAFGGNVAWVEKPVH